MSVAVYILVMTIVISFLFFMSFSFLSNKFLSYTNAEFYTHSFIYYIFAVSIPVILIWIAYTKSKKALEQSKVNYLLKIDERFCSSEIITARIVIHKYYLKAKKDNPIRNGQSPASHNESLQLIIGERIKISSKELSEAEDFIYLLNFLDVLETMGYLYSKKFVGDMELDELFGNSIIYFFKIFEPYIQERRQKDKDFYNRVC